MILGPRRPRPAVAPSSTRPDEVPDDPRRGIRHQRHDRARDGSPPPSPGPAPTAARRSSRTSSPAIPTRTTSLASPSPPSTPVRTCSRSACRTRTRSRTAPPSSGRPGGARRGGHLERSLRLIERIAAARPDVPLVPMGYANQLIGGGDGEAVARRWPGPAWPGSSSPTSRRTRARRSRPSRASAGLAVVYLVAPTTSPARRAVIAARSGGFLYCVSLVGVTGARTSLPSSVGRWSATVTAVSPVPVAVGFGVCSPRTSARSRRPAPTASSSHRPSSTRSGRTAATSRRWPGWSATCGRDARREPAPYPRTMHESGRDRRGARRQESIRVGRWTGPLCRSGKTVDLAIDALTEHAPRYAMRRAHRRDPSSRATPPTISSRSSPCPVGAGRTSGSRA